METKTGTTTIGLVYKGGVILAADKRATAGNIVAHKNIDKVHQLSDGAGITIAGLVGDVQAVVRIMRAEIALHEMRSGMKMSTQAIVGLLSTILFNGRMSMNPFLGGFILGGFDTKPQVYELDEVGSQMADRFTVTGSGGVFALGVLEADYKDDMEEEDAIKLAYKAVYTSIKRDTYTGEAVDIAVINKKGYKRLTQEEIQKVISTQ